MNEHDHETGLNLEQVLAILRRRAPLIVFCSLIVGAAAFVFSEQQPKQYTASASLVFNNNAISQELAGLPTTASTDAATQQQTNLSLLKLGPAAAQTAGQIGAGLTARSVLGSLQVSAEGESNVVKITATSRSPQLAALIANTYANRFVADQLAANQQYFASALALVKSQVRGLSRQQRASTQGLALQDREQSLTILANLQGSNVQVAQPASVPGAPSSPKVIRNTVLGLFVGLLLGLGLAFLLERLDRRIREPRDLERIYRLPLLGVIPASAALDQSSGTSDPDSLSLPPREGEVFRMLRAHLRYFNVDRDLRTLVVASAAPEDGKTTVAVNLAQVAAAMGSRVLLMEADLRRPTLAKRLSIPSSTGMADVLIGAIPLSEAVVTVGPAPVANGSNSSSSRLDVLTAGSVAPPNPAALIESKAMTDLLSSVRSEYDLVVIDTPPLTAVSDAFPLLPQVDGVIIVGRVGRNRRDVAARLHEVLKGVDAPLLGVVANGFKQTKLGSQNYEYGYAYDYHVGTAGVATNGAAAAESDEPSPARVGGE